MAISLLHETCQSVTNFWQIHVNLLGKLYIENLHSKNSAFNQGKDLKSKDKAHKYPASLSDAKSSKQDSFPDNKKLDIGNSEKKVELPLIDLRKPSAQVAQDEELREIPQLNSELKLNIKGRELDHVPVKHAKYVMPNRERPSLNIGQLNLATDPYAYPPMSSLQQNQDQRGSSYLSLYDSYGGDDDDDYDDEDDMYP